MSWLKCALLIFSLILDMLFLKKTLKIFAVQRLGHFDNIKLLSVVFDPSIDIRVVN